jgi:predicted dehydrogenase
MFFFIMNLKKFSLILLFSVIYVLFCQAQNPNPESNMKLKNDSYKYTGSPLRLGIVGLSHSHVHLLLSREKYGDIEIVGIVETNRDLAERYSIKYGFPLSIVYSSIDEMLDAVHPEAVAAFNMISQHVDVVEHCAPRGIHVMVEKPLATTVADAEKMISLAKQYNIQLITNYETTWYGSNAEAYNIINNENKIGEIRKIVFHTGHRGPVEIGCNPEFLEWLTDPVMNGGGALTDFGCYGANITTWLMKGETPLTVSCVTQHIKPEIYPKVEDEATIVLTYPKAQIIIEASWNWPYNRKDMEVYGKSGYVYCKNNTDMVFMENEGSPVNDLKAEALPFGFHDPFAFLTKVVKENYSMAPYELSSPENNLIVMKILEAARYSQEIGKTVVWAEFYKE